MVYALGFGIYKIRGVEIDRDTAAILLLALLTQSPIVYASEFFQKQMKALWYILRPNDKRRQVMRLAKIQKFDHLLGWQTVENRKNTYCQGECKMVRSTYGKEFDNP